MTRIATRGAWTVTAEPHCEQEGRFYYTLHWRIGRPSEASSSDGCVSGEGTVEGNRDCTLRNVPQAIVDWMEDVVAEHEATCPPAENV